MVRLLVIFFGISFVVVDVEVLELVRRWAGRDHMEPVTDVLLLEVLLGKVLEVSATSAPRRDALVRDEQVWRRSGE